MQGVFQDPFSSYNPIFKADRVFAMIKDEFFPRSSERSGATSVEVVARGRGLDPGHRPAASTRTSSAAASFSAC